MLTARGWWFFLTILAVLAFALWMEAATLALVGLALLSWFLGAWLLFTVRLQLLAGHLRVRRELWDERGPVASLWAGQSFAVRVALHNDRPAALPYVQAADR